MKLKKLLAIILTFIMCFTVLNVAFADETEEIPEGYTPIYTAEDLNNIRNDLDGKYILMNDIDLSVYENWVPIGTSSAPFTGELNGNDKSIFNLTISGEYSSEDNIYFALFAQMKNGAVFDLGIINADINVSFKDGAAKSFRAGILAGYANCVETKNCIVSGNITLNKFYKGAVGGLFGKENMCSPTQCVNYTNINITSDRIYEIDVGGISGVATNDTISLCGNYGDITTKSFDSDISSRTLKVGGIAGDNSDRGVISNCFNQGNINVDFCMPSIYLGGITGDCCVVENSYNAGIVTTHENYTGYIGGISGDFRPDGLAVTPAPQIKEVYYINDGLYPSYINGNVPDDYFVNVKLLTEEEFKVKESFQGFDFEGVWIMSEKHGRPVLKNQPKLPESIPERPTTKPTTEPTTETTTAPTTESTADSTTEPITEPQENECCLADFWMVRVITQLLNSIWNVITLIIDCF